MEQQKKKKRAVAFGLVAVVLIFWNLMQNTADQQKLKVACIGAVSYTHLTLPTT